jgi:hypothetical protein
MYLPRQDMSGWDWDNNTTGVPQGAVPLTGGTAILGGDIVDRLGVTSTLDYNPERPIRNTYADDAPQRDNSNHGYVTLFDHPELVSSIDRVSKQAGVPSSVLADTLAYTSEGSFSRANVPFAQETGLVDGLFPFTRSELNGTGASVSELTPDRQVQLLAPSRIDMLHEDDRTPHNVFASFLIGHKPDLLERYIKSPRSGDIIHNGVKTLNQALDQLGTHAYRQYRSETVNPRRMLTQSVAHLKPHSGCRWCSAISASGSPFTPHEAQY